jgi:hypothetical protein
MTREGTKNIKNCRAGSWISLPEEEVASSRIKKELTISLSPFTEACFFWLLICAGIVFLY